MMTKALRMGKFWYLRSGKTTQGPANWPFYISLQQSVLLLNAIPVCFGGKLKREGESKPTD